jgi:DNA polymerase-3 subunit epsilon
MHGPPAAVTRLPQPTEAALALFGALVAAADALVAHHAAFDRQWFGHGALPALAIPWICSMEDIRWPAELQLRPNPSLRDLALAHRVPVWAAHRALTDCDYLVHVFQRCAQLKALLVAAQEPRELYRARAVLRGAPPGPGGGIPVERSGGGGLEPEVEQTRGGGFDLSGVAGGEGWACGSHG